MKKLLFSIFLILTSSNSQAVETKLSCDIKLITTFVNLGHKEEERFTEIITITEVGKKVFMETSSGKLAGVMVSNDTSHKNLSDKNKWYIINNNKIEDRNIEVTYKIDRVVGVFHYYYRSEGNVDLTTAEGNGSCQKIDATKRKF